MTMDDYWFLDRIGLDWIGLDWVWCLVTRTGDENDTVVQGLI